ncbi:YaaA family protein [Stackebrandtia nassauensis]|uniref:Peroxide stress protein YaaA n=1 Tax=Stackebrandtia nassauensis (strain DSM 44728 / CIP 108903 / NRRL B-16338 / NBRC 102104 / LLR-40K-21) TaxID=446470 RepID=D3QAT7_STANL|nr:peroxide stress protein YaaA [Stackebrandtia nassauensis]ADD44733.1 protein of unknown function DUF328 [Stackebrandtia nassauensis DSM 44728]
MRILLPPSEGKTTPEAGPPVALPRLLRPALGQARQQVMDALVRLCEADTDAAMRVLKLGERLRGDVAANAKLATAPAAAAEHVYTGVLFEALDLPNLSPAARKRADERVVIFSGLWGVVRPGDPIPAYRCPVGATLPHVEGKRPVGLGSFWRRQLEPELAAEFDGQFLVDLRSGPYAAMWRPAPGSHAAVRVLHERLVGGELTRSVVSHFNKATKGRLAAELLREAVEADSVASFTEALRDLKYRVEAEASRVDIIVTEL